MEKTTLIFPLLHGRWRQQFWPWVMLMFFALLSYGAWHIRHNPLWDDLSTDKKAKLRCHAEIWKTLPTDPQKRWLASQQRFYQYAKKDQEFLRQMAYHWHTLSLSEQQQQRKAYRFFLTLLPKHQAELKSIAMFFACFSFSNAGSPNSSLIREWCSYYKDFPQLSPLEYRNYIYFNFVLFIWLPFFPPSIQDSWQRMSAEERWKALKKIQRATNKRQQNLWFFVLQESQLFSEIPPQKDQKRQQK